MGELAGVHGTTAYLLWEMDARRDLPVVVGDVLAAFAAAPTLRHVWVGFDRHACCRGGVQCLPLQISCAISTCDISSP